LSAWQVHRYLKEYTRIAPGIDRTSHFVQAERALQEAEKRSGKEALRGYMRFHRLAA
jgi:hypothetical protein